MSIAIERTGTITVPKNKEADKAFDYDRARSNQLIELTINSSDTELFFAEIVQEINYAANIIIDWYEEDWIRDPKYIQNAIKSLKSKDYSYNKRLDTLVKKIIKLMEEAVKRKVGVYFFF